jgi:hypothetical protein
MLLRNEEPPPPIAKLGGSRPGPPQKLKRQKVMRGSRDGSFGRKVYARDQPEDQRAGFEVNRQDVARKKIRAAISAAMSIDLKRP